MNKKIFLDGLMIQANKVSVEKLSLGVLSGEGAFETMRAYQGTIFALKEHLARLFTGLQTLKIKPPFSKKKMEKYIYLALHKNKLKNARLRLTVWQANNRIRMSIIVLPYHAYPAVKYAEGFKATISDIKQGQRLKQPHVKSINYLSFLRAFQRAKNKGCDEAILLNQDGFLMEGSRSNIFYVKDGILYTPSLACGCLQGITRQTVLKIAQRVKIKCKEVAIPPRALFHADEAFLTNSLIEVMPLTSLQDRLISHGKIGNVTAKLLKAYRQLVRRRC